MNDAWLFHVLVESKSHGEHIENDKQQLYEAFDAVGPLRLRKVKSTVKINDLGNMHILTEPILWAPLK